MIHDAKPLPSALRQLFYVSLVRPGTCDADVAAILADARGRNRAREITGALTMTKHHFGQFIEGPTADLEALLGSLRRDPRHSDLKVLLDRPVSARTFEPWAMGFVYKLALGERLDHLFQASGTPDVSDIARLFHPDYYSATGGLH